MELKRMCELLGCEIEYSLSQDGKYSPRIAFNYYDYRFPTKEQADIWIARQIENLVFCIVKENRRLTNEDLAEIMLKKAQSNLINDFNNINGETNEQKD